MNSKGLFVGFVLFSFAVFSQSEDRIALQGMLLSEQNNLENIHVINKTAQVFTITDKNGRFTIRAKRQDTLAFSSIQHQRKDVIVTNENLLSKTLLVVLDEKINTLDEVVVGKVLTGDLLSDIKNVEGDAPVDFYDVGIPGYTGKPATQSERRLSEASTGPGGQKLKWYAPLTGSIPLNPIINAISGRTKMLKNRVKMEARETLLVSIKSRWSKDFFTSNPLDESLRADFFYFCADDAHFLTHCKNQPDDKVLAFLRMKYAAYLKNMNANGN